MRSPLVTCVCPTTAARTELLKRAIDCFLRQTYSNCEMLIVNDPGESFESRFGRVRTLVAPSKLSLGAKRNFACEQASGEIIAHFDDDDWSAPERIAAQVARLHITGLAATGYSRMKFTDGKSWWRYADAAWPLGASLCFRREFWKAHPFPDMPMGSDTIFINQALLLKQVDVIPCRDMMYAGVHPGNTWRRDYAAPVFEPAEAICA